MHTCNVRIVITLGSQGIGRVAYFLELLCRAFASHRWISLFGRLFTQVPRRGQRVEKLACREGANPASALVAWASCPAGGYADMMGARTRSFSPRPLAGGPAPRRPLLPAPGGASGPLFREGACEAALRKRRQAFGGPSRLLQAAAAYVLRGPSLGAPTYRRSSQTASR